MFQLRVQEPIPFILIVKLIWKFQKNNLIVDQKEESTNKYHFLKEQYTELSVSLAKLIFGWSLRP